MNESSAARANAVLFSLGLGLLAGLFWLADGAILLQRPAWVDEVHTLLMARSGTPAELIGHLAAGVDYSPPLYFLLAWLARGPAGANLLELLRLLSMLFVLAAIAIVFVTLRRRFPPVASAIGAFSITAHPVVVNQAFEARFYSLWLLGCALFAWTLASARTRRGPMALAAVAVATTHWYGIISIGLMALGALVARRHDWRAQLHELVPASAGLIALIACIPLALGQREALSIPTWVPAFTLGQLEALARGFWTAPLLLAGMAAGVAVLIWRTVRKTPRPTALNATSDPAVMGLVALALMPIPLMGLSLLGQPSMVGRYALPAALAWAPVLAVSMTTAGRWPSFAFGVLLLWGTFSALSGAAADQRSFAQRVKVQAESARMAIAAGGPVLFQSMHALYAAAWMDSTVAQGAAFLDLSDPAMARLVPPDGRFYQLNKGAWVERDVVRVHARRMQFPRTVADTALEPSARIFLVADDETAPRGQGGAIATAELLFPGREVRAMGGVLVVEGLPIRR